MRENKPCVWLAVTTATATNKLHACGPVMLSPYFDFSSFAFSVFVCFYIDDASAACCCAKQHGGEVCYKRCLTSSGVVVYPLGRSVLLHISCAAATAAAVLLITRNRDLSARARDFSLLISYIIILQWVLSFSGFWFYFPFFI